MRFATIWSGLTALLLVAFAQAAEQPPTGDVVVTVGAPRPVDLITRFVESLAFFRPEVVMPFVHHMTEYKAKTRVTFTSPAFSYGPRDADGKRARPLYPSDHNPIFTRHATANETILALKLHLWRSVLYQEIAHWTYLDYALAGNLVQDKVDAMYKMHEEREKQVSKPAAMPKNCISWIDVGGTKACDADSFWNVVGLDQANGAEALEIPGTMPEALSWDHLSPPVRNESLPLVVLYAAPTDPAFPQLFNELHSLSSPGKDETPRLQFALRWRPDPEFELDAFVPAFHVQATAQSGLTVPEIKNPAEFSHRAIAYIRAAKDKFGALSRVAGQLPLVAEQIAKTPVRRSLRAKSSLKEELLLNGIPVEPRTLTHEGLLGLFERDRQLLLAMGKAVDGLSLAENRDFIYKANVTFETPRKSASSLVIPTVARPLHFVAFDEAFKNIPTYVIREAWLEGAMPDASDGDSDPPALASFILLADLDSPTGRSLIRNAMQFAEQTEQVRFLFVHNPASSASIPHKYAPSRVIGELSVNRTINEVFPSELISFLDYEATPQNPPKRSLDDAWTGESPVTPFVSEGALNSTLYEVYTGYAATIAKQFGLRPGEAAVVLNGRVVRLPTGEFAAGSFSALHQYELKRRIKPVVDAASPVLTTAADKDRRERADLYSWSTSIVGALGVKRRYLPAEDTKGLATLTAGNSTLGIFQLVAVMNPLSNFAREVAPVLDQLRAMAFTHITVHLLPVEAPQIDTTKLTSRSFPVVLRINQADDSELAPNVTLSGLPQGAVVDVRAFSPRAFQYAGAGGVGGESVRVPGHARFGTQPVAREQARESSAGHVVRDEL